MRRGSVNGIGQGLHGDVTTTGAVCISSLPSATQGSGQSVLRLGDKTTQCRQCGEEGVIVESLPAMRWMGIATALDGAVIHCGCPRGRNRLIAPLRTDVPPQAASASTRPMNYSDKSASENSSLAGQKPRATAPPAPGIPGENSSTCNHPDQMEELAQYIAGEMNRNICHPSVLKMKELLSYDVAEETRKQMELPWYAKVGRNNPQAIGAANGTAAMAIWTERVGQNRPWDHKPIIRRTIGGIRHKQGNYDYFYDIWSNIHYGYVGMAGGLSETILLDGAGVEQIASDSLRKFGEKMTELFTRQTAEKPLPGPHRSGDVEGLRAWDDAPDRISISIGVQLFREQSNGGITARMVMDKVLAISPTEWGEGVRAHKCET